MTDGTIGPLNPETNIVGWNLLWNDGATTFVLSPGPNQEVFAHDAPLSATATQLLFNFSGNTGDNFFFFANLDFPEHEVCFEASPSTCVSGVPAGAEQINLFTNGAGDLTEFTVLSGTQVIGTTVAAVPVPKLGTFSTLLLLGAGLGALELMRARKPTT